jgi:hypothetical protein
MITIQYKRADMVFQAIGCLFLAGLGAYMAMQDTMWQLRLLGGLLAISLPVVSIALAMRAYNNAAAIQYDRKHLTLATLWTSVDLPWSAIRSIHRETLQQQSAFGLIKQNIGYYLVVTAHIDDNNERTFKINERLLDWPVAQMPQLASDLIAAANGALQEQRQPTHRPAPAGANPGGVGGFGRRGV